MATIRDIIQALEEIAPLPLQESYDNAGLIVGDETHQVGGILFCLDSTSAIVEEAILKKCNFIIAHHPIVFSGIKKFNNKHYAESAVILAIKNDIAIYACHTNLDNVLFKGVNQKIADKLGLISCRILKEKEPEIGSGLIGELENQIPFEEFMANIQQVFNLKVIKYTKIHKAFVKKVAVCGGAGSFLIKDVIHAGADVFLTSDLKYHEYFEANDQLVFMDIGHYESEQFTVELFSDIIKNKFPNFAVYSTDRNTNPVNYFI